MDTTVLRSLIEVQPRPPDGPPTPPNESLGPLMAPAKAVHRTYPGALHQADSMEMRPAAERGSVTPRTGSDPDLEMSPPPTPGPAAEPVEAMASVWEPFMNRFRLLAVCLANLGNALSDGAAGALIPYMEKYYDIGYGVVSLIFVGQAAGFIVAAVVLDTLRAKLGWARVLELGQALMTLGYIPMAAAAPFVLVALSFIGFGIAIQVAMGNIFCGRLQNGMVMLGLLHGSYGVGGTVGPILATLIVTAAGALWSRYYLLTLSLGVVNVALTLWSFWGFDREPSPAAREGQKRHDGGATKPLLGSMIAALRMRVVLLGAVFVFAYQGAEVSISGWVISFLIQARGGDPSSVGYVSAGFWVGIMLGRFLLSGPAQRIGEKVFVYGLTGGAIAFQLLVWWVPNIVGEAVAVSIVGLLLGPVYPCAAAVFMRAMSGRQALSGMGTISAFGSLGGALAPFVTGLLAHAVGTYVLHPIVIALFVVMLLCWYAMPSPAKRTE